MSRSRRPAWWRDAVDTRDVLFFGGLILAAGGGVMLSVPWTLIVVGATLTAIAALGGR